VNRSSKFKAEKMRKLEYTIIRREKREMCRKCKPDEDPRVCAETTPALQIEEVVPRYRVGDYVTVLPDTTARSGSFWGYQGYVVRVDVSVQGTVFYEIKNSALHGYNGHS
jgi:hypothetical protein